MTIRVKGLLAHQGIQKALREEKPTNMTKVYCMEMMDKAAWMICFCVLDKVKYHTLYLTSPKELWEKLEC